MTTKSKTAKKAAASKKTTKKSTPKKKTAKSAPAIDTTPVADPCAAGHTWETDAEGVEHCTVCLADRKVIEGAAAEKPVKAPKPAKAKKAAKPAKTEPKLSALDSAAQILASSSEPLNTKQMIEQMAAKGLWTSPGGKTPSATLYSALLREIQVKGRDARFKKTERGQFAING